MQSKKLAIGLGLVVAVVLAIAATPKVIGMSLRDNTVDTLFALIPPETSQQLQITETNFNEGWLSSNAEFQVVFAPLGLSETLTGTLEFEIKHGPVIMTPQGMEFGLAHATITPRFTSKEFVKAMTQVPFELPQVSFELLARFDQSLLLELTISPVNINEAEASVSFEGLTGTLLANPDMSAEIQVMMGGLRATATESGMGFDLASMRLDSSSQQLNDLLAPSQAMLSIPSISSAAPFEFAVANIEAQSRVSPGLDPTRQVNIYQRLKVGSITSEIPINSISWTTEINELQTDLVRTYYEFIADMQQQIAAGSGAMPSEETALELALLLAQNSLVFNNMVAANLYDGDHEADIKVRWQGLPDLQSLEGIEIPQVLAALEVEVNVALDMEAVMRSPAAEMVDPYVQQGYFVIDNGRLLFNASLANNELMVNGEATPLDQFL